MLTRPCARCRRAGGRVNRVERIGDLDPFAGVGPGRITAVFETTRGGRSKLADDRSLGAMRLRHVLPEGMAFPFDVGFVPGTRAGDGDPLDVPLLVDQGLPAGAVLETRVIAVPAVARAAAAVRTLDDLRPGWVDEIEAFLVNYNQMRGIRFEPLGRHGPDLALLMVRDARTGRAAARL